MIVVEFKSVFKDKMYYTLNMELIHNSKYVRHVNTIDELSVEERNDILSQYYFMRMRLNLIENIINP